MHVALLAFHIDWFPPFLHFFPPEYFYNYRISYWLRKNEPRMCSWVRDEAWAALLTLLMSLKPTRGTPFIFPLSAWALFSADGVNGALGTSRWKMFICCYLWILAVLNAQPFKPLGKLLIAFRALPRLLLLPSAAVFSHLSPSPLVEVELRHSCLMAQLSFLPAHCPVLPWLWECWYVILTCLPHFLCHRIFLFPSVGSFIPKGRCQSEQNSEFGPSVVSLGPLELGSCTHSWEPHGARALLNMKPKTTLWNH